MRFTGFVLCCAVVLFSCKKDEQNIPDRAYFISKVYYYLGDSTKDIHFKDSIYYQNNRISKIVTTRLKWDTITQEFTYNAAGKLTLMTARQTPQATVNYDQDYHFYYNANGQLDSMRKVDRTRWDDNVFYSMTYDDNKLLRSVRLYATVDGVESPYDDWLATYMRNAAGKLDSIVYGVGENAYVSIPGVPEDDSIQFEDALKLTTAIKTYSSLLGRRNYPNVNTNALFSPTDYFFRSGVQNGLPYTLGVTKNGLGLVHSYWLTGGSAPETYFTVRFEYRRG